MINLLYVIGFIIFIGLLLVIYLIYHINKSTNNEMSEKEIEYWINNAASNLNILKKVELTDSEFREINFLIEKKDKKYKIVYRSPIWKNSPLKSRAKFKIYEKKRKLVKIVN